MNANPRERFLLLGFHLFGNEFDPAAEKVWDRIVIDDTRIAQVKFDEKSKEVARIYLYTSIADIHVAHEVGHVMHCVLWPEATAKALKCQMERVALWSEGRLFAMAPGQGAAFAQWIQGRLRPLSTERGRGPHGAAARWLLKHIDTHHPLRGIEWAGPDLLARMKDVLLAKA